MFFASIFSIWAIPFIFTFWNSEIFHTLDFLPAFILDLFFFADIFVIFHTGFLKDGVVFNDKQTHIPFWREVIMWIAPWPIISIGYFLNNLQLTRILSFFYLFRLVRLFDSSYTISTTLVYIHPVSKFLLYFSLFFTVIHIFSCIIWGIGNSEMEHSKNSWLLIKGTSKESFLGQYFHSLYFITTTVLTIGYGDLHPVTFNEIIVTIIIELLGVFCYSFLTSNLVAHGANPSYLSFLAKFQLKDQALKRQGISSPSRIELLRYYEYIWEKSQNTSFESISRNLGLPNSLQKKIGLALRSNLFSSIPALSELSYEVYEQIALSLKLRIFTPGDYLIRPGKVSNRIFLISDGTVSLVSLTGALIARLNNASGVILGEESMIYRTEETACAYAETYVEAYELLRADFESIPELRNAFESNFLSHFDSIQTIPPLIPSP